MVHDLLSDNSWAAREDCIFYNLLARELLYDHKTCTRWVYSYYYLWNKRKPLTWGCVSVCSSHSFNFNCDVMGCIVGSKYCFIQIVSNRWYLDVHIMPHLGLSWLVMTVKNCWPWKMSAMSELNLCVDTKSWWVSYSMFRYTCLP